MERIPSVQIQSAVLKSLKYQPRCFVDSFMVQHSTTECDDNTKLCSRNVKNKFRHYFCNDGRILCNRYAPPKITFYETFKATTAKAIP